MRGRGEGIVERPSLSLPRCIPHSALSPGETTRPESAASRRKGITTEERRRGRCRRQRRRETHPRRQARSETAILYQARNTNFRCDFDAHRGSLKGASGTTTFVERAKGRSRQWWPQRSWSCRCQKLRGRVARWGWGESTNVGPCANCFSCCSELFSPFQSQIGAERHQFFVSGWWASTREEDARARGAYDYPLPCVLVGLFAATLRRGLRLRDRCQDSPVVSRSHVSVWIVVLRPVLTGSLLAFLAHHFRLCIVTVRYKHINATTLQSS